MPPAVATLGIHELDDQIVGKFSFHCRETVLKILSGNGGIENLQVTLMAEVWQYVLILDELNGDGCVLRMLTKMLCWSPVNWTHYSYSVKWSWTGLPVNCLMETSGIEVVYGMLWSSSFTGLSVNRCYWTNCVCHRVRLATSLPLNWPSYLPEWGNSCSCPFRDTRYI